MIGVGGKWAILGEIVASSELYPMDTNPFPGRPMRTMRTNNSPIRVLANPGGCWSAKGQNGSGYGVYKGLEELISC
jgi:hypothetical protein